MIRKRVKKQWEEPMINLTPLIDVVFVILIMFIVVAPLLDLDRIELADGTVAEPASARGTQERSPVSIHVYADNTVFLNQQPVLLKELPSRLAALKHVHPSVRPQVFHDRKAAFGTYQTVKNAVESAGFSQMDVILKPN